MDFRATWTVRTDRSRVRIFLDVFNLYNRNNLRYRDYEIALPEGRVVAEPGGTLLPLLPSFGITWEF